MEIWQKQIPFTASSSITKELLSKSSLLFDIETTGFSATNNHVCLIGCAAKQEDALQFTQPSVRRHKLCIDFFHK